MFLDEKEIIESHEIAIAELCLWIMQITGWQSISTIKDGLSDELHDSIDRAWVREY